MAIFLELLRPAQVALAIVLLGTAYIVGVCIYRIYFHPLAKYPGPFWAKITDWYSAYQNYTNDVHLDCLRCHEKYGDFVRYGPNKLLVNSANGFYDIYGHAKNTQKSDAYLALMSRDEQGKRSAHSILTSWNKKEHGRKRRVIGQGFTEAAVRGYEPIILSQIRVLCEKLVETDSSVGVSKGGLEKWGSPKDLATWSNYFSFDIMTDVIFSHPLELMSRPENRYVPGVINDMMHRIGVMSQVPYVITWGLESLVLPSGNRAWERFRIVAKNMAVSRLQLSVADDHKDAFKNLVDAKDPETGKSLELQELLAEAGVLIVAGSDTTSSAMAAIFFYLSRNPRVYNKLAEEVRTTFSDAADIHSGPEIRSCTYLRACVDEALRMGPPVAAAPWRVTQRGGADIGGEHIGEGTTVGTALYALHHNKAYFAKPFEFSPERWIPSDTNPQESIELAKQAFAPFLIGARMCAAKNMAITELYLMVAQVMWSMDFKIAEGPAGLTGQGKQGLAQGREREDEFQLYSHFVTVAKRGPVLQFRKRQ